MVVVGDTWLQARIRIERRQLYSMLLESGKVSENVMQCDAM